jgi:hypothetical protein
MTLRDPGFGPVRGQLPDVATIMIGSGWLDFAEYGSTDCPAWIAGECRSSGPGRGRRI